MNDPKFQLFKDRANNQYHYRLRSRNGEIILNGEEYTIKKYCLDGIASVKECAPYDNRYERKGTNYNYTFNLKAWNGQIIGRSEKYTSSVAREDGIVAVKSDAPRAPVEGLS